MAVYVHAHVEVCVYTCVHVYQYTAPYSRRAGIYVVCVRAFACVYMCISYIHCTVGVRGRGEEDQVARVDVAAHDGAASEILVARHDAAYAAQSIKHKA